MYKMSKDKQNYEVYKGLLSGDQVHTLNSETVLECVQEKALADLGNSDRVFVLHDPCEIRKPNSQEMEYIGKVLSLEKKVVNGYHTFNSVAVDPTRTNVQLLCHETYSTGMDRYISQSELANPQTLDISKQTLITNGTYVNTNILYKKHISTSSQLLKQEQANRVICHISDREFDDEDSFNYIHSLGDEFITRVKLSRVSNEEIPLLTPKLGKPSKKKAHVKLVDHKFPNRAAYAIDQLSIKGKHYGQVTCELQWGPIRLKKHTYNAVKISLKHEGKNIFQQPMILITNRPIGNQEHAKEVYRAYILRFKIEIVFRFLKQELGWESFQVRDFNSIKNLLAIAFYLVGYFKEIEEVLKEHPLTKFLCQLARSKGKITLFFILEGLRNLIQYQEVKKWKEENNISDDQIQEMIEYAKSNYTEVY